MSSYIFQDNLSEIALYMNGESTSIQPIYFFTLLVNPYQSTEWRNIDESLTTIRENFVEE